MATTATILNDAPSQYSGSTAAAEAQSAWPWISLGLQLGAALLLIHEFRVESRTFFNVAVLVVSGFVVHAMLPLRARLPMFAAISLASLGVAFGLRDAAVLFLIGVALIGICHLPGRLGLRVLLLLAAGSLLVAVRASVLAPLGSALAPSIMPFGVWVILGSMFMFRIVLYIHALHTRTADDPEPSIARTLAYFFMAPNVCFPLFPVVDYNGFAKNYYDRPALEIYQTGARWIARGLFQLLLYRVIYGHLANDPAWLGNLAELLQYLLSTYLLYLRVSGSFHLIVGMLCLFGFRLPETHHLYYLATSFTEIWRRINIYWKDFMMKLVYYPSFFRLRKMAPRNSVLPIAVSTVFVFVATWALHSYQWYWLKGELLLSWPDVLFWTVLAGLVVWNSLREARSGRQRVVSTGRTGWRDWRLSRALKVVGMFSAMTILWSFWSAESVIDWVIMWRAASNVRLADLLVLLGFLALGLLIGGRSWDTTPITAAHRPWYRNPALSTFALLLGPLTLSRPEIQRQFGPQAASFLESLEHTSLNSRDEARQHRGYYERMDADARLTVALWENTPAIPADFVPFQHTIGRRNRTDFLLDELRPSTTVRFHNHDVNINRWGMRGPEVQLEKPAGTLRIATIGPSYLFGWGVADSGRIQPAMEDRLNVTAKRNGWPRIEVLDFSFPAYAITQQLAMLDDRVYNFAPDIVLVSMDRWTYRHVDWHLDRVIAQRGIPIPYAGLRELLASNGIEFQQQGRALPFSWVRSAARSVGVPARTPQKETRARIRELSDTIVAWSLAEIVRSIRAHNAIPVVVAFQMIEFDTKGSYADVDHLLNIARKAGMIVVDVRDVLRGLDPAFLRVTDWETHPNARGNRLLGNQIAAELEPHILQRVRSTQWMTSSVR